MSRLELEEGEEEEEEEEEERSTSNITKTRKFGSYERWIEGQWMDKTECLFVIREKIKNILYFIVFLHIFHNLFRIPCFHVI